MLQFFIPGLQGFNALSAGLVLGISILPLVASLSEDAIYSVPASMREGSYALGATKTGNHRVSGTTGSPVGHLLPL